MAWQVHPSIVKRFAAGIIIGVIGFGFAASVLLADGTHLLNRSLTLADSQPGKTALYRFGFRPTGLDTIQTVVLQFCSNDPYPGKPCTAPVGLDASGATLISQSGDVGFNVSPMTTTNRIVLSRPPFASNGGQDSYTFNTIVNPANNGSYFVRIQTYTDSDTTAEANYYGGLSFAINSAVNVQATVPPYLLFCVGITVAGYDCDNVVGNYVDFGEFSSRQASQGSTQMLAASNAKDGYNIRVNGTTLTSGTNSIPALTSSDVSRPGLSQFGMNLRANSAPQGGVEAGGPGGGQAAVGYNQANFYRFNSGDVVAVSTAPDEARKYSVSYVVNIDKNQSPGVYVSTLTYTALGNY